MNIKEDNQKKQHYREVRLQRSSCQKCKWDLDTQHESYTRSREAERVSLKINSFLFLNDNAVPKLVNSFKTITSASTQRRDICGRLKRRRVWCNRRRKEKHSPGCVSVTSKREERRDTWSESHKSVITNTLLYTTTDWDMTTFLSQYLSKVANSQKWFSS